MYVYIDCMYYYYIHIRSIDHYLYVERDWKTDITVQFVPPMSIDNNITQGYEEKVLLV